MVKVLPTPYIGYACRVGFHASASYAPCKGYDLDSNKVQRKCECECHESTEVQKRLPKEADEFKAD